MQTENPSVVIWQGDVPVLWRAGALEAEAISDETVLPQSVVIGLPSDDVRTAVLRCPRMSGNTCGARCPHDGRAGGG